MKKTRRLFSFDSLFNVYREDTSTLTHSFNLNDPPMQMSYIWERMMLKRAPNLEEREKLLSWEVMVLTLKMTKRELTRSQPRL